MIPVPGGWGFAIALLLLAGALAAGFVVIVASTASLVASDRWPSVGCALGALPACGWVWLLARADNARATIHLAVLVGVPLGFAVASRTAVALRRRHAGSRSPLSSASCHDRRS